MIKRLFDIVVATILLLIFAPVMFVVALCIKFDSPGPILYASPRVGKGGKRYGLFRFRTVDLDKPSYLSMRERLSRVGRFIRNYSLDDVPNFFNILRGDMSIIGPRATEPERVDLTDPIWQKILSVRPGVMSPAVLLLAQQYNASPNSLKQQLELEYVQMHSFGYDLQLFRQALRGYFVSRGNWKARGKPAITVEYARYQGSTPTAPQPKAVNADDYAWHVADWDQPDLSYVAAFVQAHGHGWQAYEPQFCLVPCANSLQKPAIFLREGEGHVVWSDALEVREIEWVIAATNRYVCLGCVLHFEDKTQASVDLGQQRFACGTLLDVASPAVEAWFSIWRHCQETIVFLVKHELGEIQHRFWFGEGDGKGGADTKAQAIQKWEETKTRLAQSGHALENFVEEAKLLRRTLPGLGGGNVRR